MMSERPRCLCQNAVIHADKVKRFVARLGYLTAVVYDMWPELSAPGKTHPPNSFLEAVNHFIVTANKKVAVRSYHELDHHHPSDSPSPLHRNDDGETVVAADMLGLWWHWWEVNVCPLFAVVPGPPAVTRGPDGATQGVPATG